MSKPQPKIAVIGPSQSGKTCLAVGLYNVRRPNLSVSAPNLNNKEYLEARTKKLRNGGWPDGNLPGTLEDIQLDFHARGASTRISFEDFAGEILASDETFIPFANEHFRRLDGVVLLVNPGAAAFTSEERFSECLSQYRRILTFLGNSNNGARPRVALAVTAADRLAGDLKDSGVAARFRECREGIEAELTNRGFDAETFEVTITGPLADQEKPKLARGSEITAAEPFLWLVDRITDYPKRVKRRKIWATCALGAVAIALLAAGIGRWIRIDREAKILEECSEALDAIQPKQNAKPKPEQLKAATDAVSTLQKRHWLDSNTNEVARLLGEFGPAVADARSRVARRNLNLEELAGLLREAETDEFLKPHAASLSEAFDITFDTYISELAAAVDGHGGKVSREDEGKIRADAVAIGQPFDADKAVEALRSRVEELADPKRKVCYDWKSDNVRPTCKRTGSEGLLREYANARARGELKANPFVDEIVRPAVYGQYEQWLEADIDSCGEALQDKESFENWFQRFKDTCLELAGKNAPDPNPDKSTWAWQYAKRCEETGQFREEPLASFPQTLEITRIDFRMDYGGNFPFNYDGTAFRVELLALDAHAQSWSFKLICTILDDSKSTPFEKADEKKWKTVWEGEFRQETGLFAVPVLRVIAVDKQPWWSTEDIELPLLEEVTIALPEFSTTDKDGNSCWEFQSEVELGRATGADTIKFEGRIYGTVTGETPETLRDTVRQEVSGEGKR